MISISIYYDNFLEKWVNDFFQEGITLYQINSGTVTTVILQDIMNNNHS